VKGAFGVIGVLDGWKKGDLPGNQMVNIVLNDYTTLNNGNISITQELASDSEVDCVIDGLIRDLELARKKAKANIKKTNDKIAALI